MADIIIKTNGKRNRQAGHSFELESTKAMREIGFPYVVTSRSENRSRDAAKVDLINKDEFKNGRLPYNIQCKNCTGKLPYHALLSSMPKDHGINVIYHKKTERSNTKFMEQGCYAILARADFLKIIGELEACKKRLHDLDHLKDFI